MKIFDNLFSMISIDDQCFFKPKLSIFYITKLGKFYSCSVNLTSFAILLGKKPNFQYQKIESFFLPMP